MIYIVLCIWIHTIYVFAIIYEHNKIIFKYKFKRTNARAHTVFNIKVNIYITILLLKLRKIVISLFSILN